MGIRTNEAGGQLIDDMIVSGLRESGQVYQVEYIAPDEESSLVGIFTNLERARTAVVECAAAESAAWGEDSPRWELWWIDLDADQGVGD